MINDTKNLPPGAKKSEGRTKYTHVLLELLSLVWVSSKEKVLAEGTSSHLKSVYLSSDVCLSLTVPPKPVKEFCAHK